MGNIKFNMKEMDESAVLASESEPTVKIIAELLQLNPTDFADFLTCKRSQVNNSDIKTNLSLIEAQQAISGLARMIYFRLFQSMIRTINKNINADSEGIHNKNFYVGILDIYGFEIF